MHKVFLSIVIPCYDEMANLQKGVLDKVAHFLDKKKWDYEVIIVDDGSRDGSVEFVSAFIKENPHFVLVKSPHRGKAGAVTTGMLKAKGEHVLFTDMDQATPIEEIDKLLPQFEKGYDIVIGSRNNQRKNSPWTRKLMSRTWMILRTMVIGLDGISDTQCGFKAFKQKPAQKLFKKIQEIHNGFKNVSGSSVSAGFDVELLFIAKKMGYQIKEVPVSWLYVETRRVSPIKDSTDGLIELFRIKVNSLKGTYKV
jgi:dolichyl-phosphate beta-glucosyltransferase